MVRYYGYDQRQSRYIDVPIRYIGASLNSTKKWRFLFLAPSCSCGWTTRGVKVISECRVLLPYLVVDDITDHESTIIAKWRHLVFEGSRSGRPGSRRSSKVCRRCRRHHDPQDIYIYLYPCQSAHRRCSVSRLLIIIMAKFFCAFLFSIF